MTALSRTTRTLKCTFDGKTMTSELFDNMEIDGKDILENHLAAKEITAGQKYLVLVIGAPNTTINADGRDEANMPGKYANVIAQAVVVKSLANRIVGNFLINFYKPACPMSLFSEKEKAVEWLNEQWEIYHGNKTKSGKRNLILT